jgi:hypothetical protein
MSTVMVDSVSTSGTGNFLVGKYSDKYLGDIRSTGFFQLDIPEDLDLNEKAVFDSLTLILKYSGMSYGDTLLQQNISVHRVTEEISTNDNGLLYNISSFEYQDIPEGSLSFYAKPNFNDTLEIKLADSLGNEIFKLMENDADEISTSEDFLEYFKGLAIVAGENNSCVLSFEGLDSLVSIRLYTHYVAQNRVEVSYDFPLYSSSTCFSQIKADRLGSALENLKTQREEISSSETMDMTFLQGGLGLYTRLDFPGLGRMLEMDKSNILYKAELILKPYPDAYLSYELPEDLILYNTDKYNNLGSTVADNDGDIIYADFSLDKVYNEYTYYSFDVTTNIIAFLANGYVNVENGIIVALTDEKMNNSLDRLAFDTRSGLSFKPTLKLYYIFYE